MLKPIKILVVAISLGSAFFVALFPAIMGHAAPRALPACGHGSVSQSSSKASGPPAIAQSQDSSQYFTAIAWSQGADSSSPAGTIELAYSNVMTTTRGWSRLTVDSAVADGNRDPSIVFDPVISDTVHIAYRKNNGIYYRRCDLGNGTCPVAKDLTATANNGMSVIDNNPQIAFMDSLSTVVIIYQHKDGAGNDLLEYAYIRNSGTGSQFSDLTLTDNPRSIYIEENPTIAYANGKVHVAYTKDNIGNTVDSIEYLNFSSLGPTGLTPLEQFDLNQVGTLNDLEPLFPAIGAAGNTVGLVWQIDDDNGFNDLAYVISTDGGSSWTPNGAGNNFYRYAFTGDGSNNGSGRASWITDNPNDQFTGGLKPDIFVDGSTFHVVWQAKTGSSHDIYYSRFSDTATPKWQNGSTTQLFTETQTISYTNMTEMYRDGITVPEFGSSVEPAVIFGEPGNRLQVVYMSKVSGASWDIYYNGWQLGSGEGTTFSFEDTDCDWLPDLDTTKGFPGNAEFVPPGETCGGIEPNDCDGDGILNFMDEDADGDGSPDYAEIVGGTNPWDEESSLPKTFLPIVLKN